jgi:hypothetical protein
MLSWIETETGINLYQGFPKEITDFSFGITDEEDIIRLNPSHASGGKTPIMVILPASYAGGLINLTPAIEYTGKSISPGSGVSRNFTSPVTYTVFANDGTSRDYEVEVIVKTAASAELKWFDLELPNGTYLAEGAVDQGPPGTVTLNVPSGTNLSSLTAKIVQTGVLFTSPTAQYITSNSEPEIILTDNFSSPVTYTVTADDNTTKTYTVTVNVDQSDDNEILGFAVTAHKNAPNVSVPVSPQVVIGENPRTWPNDGRIPIVIHVPYDTDESDMRATITLPAGATINPSSGIVIPFGNKGNNKEAVYTVTAANNAPRNYVVLVSEGPGYYYVDPATGRDDWPDIHNGGSESQPFKTLAYAVWQAAIDGIPEVRIMGDLDVADTNVVANDNNSVFAIDLSSTANKTVTITSSVPGVTRTLTGDSSHRVLSITGGADLTFKDINVTGGNTPGNGGGIYVGGNSKVNFTGNITGNTAKSGGGVYLEAGTGPSDFSTFTLTGGTIANNTATGNTSGEPDVSLMSGGGGVYIKGNATFTLDSGGTISNNTAAGAGGGVLVNGTSFTYGLLMPNGGKITGNKSTSSIYPHGGGGVYVARGFFDMENGEITGNTAVRQGGGVFVHWGDARFAASGSSTITGNTGVGSSKAICNRGTTELLGTTKADYVYIWDYDGATPSQRFTLQDNVQITTGIALACAASESNKNFITLVGNLPDMTTETSAIAIDLESHLENGSYVGTSPDTDWVGKKIIEGNNITLQAILPRLILNTFKGASLTQQLYKNYEITVTGTTGTFEHQ